MKIVLFVHCFFPDHYYGTETYTLQIARGLRDLGHEVTVVAGVFQGEPKRAGLITHGTYADLSVVYIDKNFAPHVRVKETYWQESMRHHLRALLSELKPDVIHVTHLINHTGVLLDEAKRIGCRLIGTLTDFFGFCYNNKLEAANGRLCKGPNILRTNCLACHLKAVKPVSSGGQYLANAFLMRFQYELRQIWSETTDATVQDIVGRPKILFDAYSCYDAMVAPTAFLREAYVRKGFDAKRLHLSRFGIDVSRATKPARLSSVPLTIGFIGQIAPHKGVHLLVEAARCLPYDSHRLYIYGSGDQFPAYMTMLREMAGPTTSFRQPFPSSDMANVLADIDLLAIPSTWYENSPLVLLNALATHTPVLVSDVQGLTEFVDEGKNGWSFRRGDRYDLLRVLTDLVKNPENVREISRSTNYERTTASMTSDLIELYSL